MNDSDRPASARPGPNDIEPMADEYVDALLSTAEDFETLLQVLVLTAHANGIDVRGGWPVVPDDGRTGSWDVEIVEVDREG